jgi:hypothetical protein
MHSPWFGSGMLEFPAADAGSRAPVEKMKTTEKNVNRWRSMRRSQQQSFGYFDIEFVYGKCWRKK